MKNKRIKDFIESLPEEKRRNAENAISGMKMLLDFVDDNPGREGIQDTPLRYVKFMEEFTRPQDFELREFDGEQYGGMVVQSNIPFYSLCEHHLAPFHGTATIAYIPNGKIVGLSKLARTLDKFARKLQNQERITSQVCEYLQQKLDCKGVAVVITAQHLCMSMRGVQKHDTWTTTTKLYGLFSDDERTRNEFYQILNYSKK